MVMRSDGGIMDIEEMRRRPILTMLSGPAAGVAAALMVAKISDGVFLEVGGTSTDISLIRNGRPAMRSAELAGHRLHIRTLDVRTAGVGGGSMVRMLGMRVVDVGPRSAHIAGLCYPAFATAEELDDLEPTSAAPRGGDPADYLVLRAAGSIGHASPLPPRRRPISWRSVKGYGAAREVPRTASPALLQDFLAEDPRSFARAVLRQASLRPSRIIRRALKDYELAASGLRSGGEEGPGPSSLPLPSSWRWTFV